MAELATISESTKSTNDRINEACILSQPSYTIVYIGTESNTQNFVQSVLEGSDNRVLFLNDIVDLKEHIDRENPNLLIWDDSINDVLPVGDVFSVAQDVCNCNDGDIPMMFLLSRDTALGDVEKILCSGATYLVKPFAEMDLRVKVGVALEISITRRQLKNQAAGMAKVIAEQESRLDQVRDGQENLLANPDDFTDINVAVKFVPAYEAGGDFYDIVRLGDNYYGFVVADVAGHDLGTAYLTGALKALTVSFTNETLTVSDSMVMMNMALGRFLQAGQYASACYVKYSRTNSTIDIINAGHPAALLQREDGSTEYINLVGDVLGIHDTVICNSRQIVVKPSQRLFLYTDGLTESCPNAEGKTGQRVVGEKYLSQQVTAKRTMPLKKAVDSIIEELLELNNGQVDDDVMLMAIEF